MTFKLNKKPDCANPNCKNLAIIMVGHRFFCGDCAMIAMKRQKEFEDNFIMEGFKNDN